MLPVVPGFQAVRVLRLFRGFGLLRIFGLFRVFRILRIFYVILIDQFPIVIYVLCIFIHSNAVSIDHALGHLKNFFNRRSLLYVYLQRAVRYSSVIFYIIRISIKGNPQAFHFSIVDKVGRSRLAFGKIART